MYKDPIWYYFVIPFILLAIQLIGLLVFIKLKRSVERKCEQVAALFKTDNTNYRIVTRKEAEMRAHANEQERITANHRILVQQGEDNE